MRRIILSIVCTVIGLTAALQAAEIKAGPVTLSRSNAQMLWDQARAGKRIFSDAHSPEAGKVLDVSASMDRELAAKVKRLNTDAPCKLSRTTSKHGDELVVLENGLVKVVILPAYGGRIIEISNKVTGKNIFMDNYSQAAAVPVVDKKKRPPHMLGGWIESPGGKNSSYWNTPHEVATVKASADELVVKTTGQVKNKSWGVSGSVTIVRTIGIRTGSSHVSLDIVYTNHSGDKQRGMQFKSQTRHALGATAVDDEFWLSSLGYVTNVPPNHKGDCYNTLRCEEKIDTWQAILDRNEREGVVVLPSGEIDGRMCIYATTDKKTKTQWYTYENASTPREHVVEGVTIKVGHGYAPVLNFDAVTFANDQLAVEFVPEALHVAPGQTLKVLVGAAAIDSSAVGTITLTPRFVRNGKTLAKSKPISVSAGLLVAAPRIAEFTVPAGLASGPCDLVVDVATAELVGSFRYRSFVVDPAGGFLTVLHPEDDGFGRGLSVTGRLEQAELIVQNASASKSIGTYKLAGASLPWETTITPTGQAFEITHTVDLSAFPTGARLQSLGLSFPFRLGTGQSQLDVGAQRTRHQYQKGLVVTVGSTYRDEQWLVDQARGSHEQEYHKRIPSYSLSDKADRFPVWRFGGVLQQSATSAWIWKSAGYDVAPMITVREYAAAGWVDAYSRLQGQGVLVYMPDMAAAAPREIIFDGEIGAFRVYLFPPHVPAMSLTKAAAQGKSQAELWGLGPDKKITLSFMVFFHEQDLTGWLSQKGNKAEKIRKIIAGSKRTQ